VGASGLCVEHKIHGLEIILTYGSTQMQSNQVCIWLDREMGHAQNPQLDHTQSASFAFRSTERLGV